MASATIPVDLRNPGQVFACLGFMEAAEILCGACKGRFQVSPPNFQISSEGEVSPIEVAISFLRRCELWVEIPKGSRIADNSKQPTRTGPAGLSYSKDLKGDRLPVRLETPEADILISNWADSDSGRELIKFWGGASGFSGAGRVAGQLDSIRALPEESVAVIAADPFALFAADAKTAFRLDCRSGYTPLDLGSSLDQHGNARLPKYPLTEILGVLGLEHARPVRNESRLLYSYWAWIDWLPTPLARAALGGANLGFDLLKFTITLAEPNEYDRVILDVRDG